MTWLQVEMQLEKEWDVRLPPSARPGTHKIVCRRCKRILTLRCSSENKGLELERSNQTSSLYSHVGEKGLTRHPLMGDCSDNDNRVILHDLKIEAEEDPTFINASYVDNVRVPCLGSIMVVTEPLQEIVHCSRHAAQLRLGERLLEVFDANNIISRALTGRRMAYEAKVQTIVMLNKPTERKKNPYWPSKKERVRSYLNVIKVILLEEKYDDQIYCWVREFQVVVNLAHYEEGAEDWKFSDEYLINQSYNFDLPDLTPEQECLKKSSHRVTHLQYDDWDDMRVPDDKTIFYQFVSMTLKQHEERKAQGPMVVHCFGGVGRTGTFLVIHSTCAKITRLGGRVINVVELLGMLRSERSSLVQTPVR
jgi:hypothetical protein